MKSFEYKMYPDSDYDENDWDVKFRYHPSVQSCLGLTSQDEQQEDGLQ